MTRTKRWMNKRSQLDKEIDDFDEYITKLEEENERLKAENQVLKKEIAIDEIIINFMKELVDFDAEA